MWILELLTTGSNFRKGEADSLQIGLFWRAWFNRSVRGEALSGASGEEVSSILQPLTGHRSAKSLHRHQSQFFWSLSLILLLISSPSTCRQAKSAFGFSPRNLISLSPYPPSFSPSWFLIDKANFWWVDQVLWVLLVDACVLCCRQHVHGQSPLRRDYQNTCKG